jgi:Ion channel
VLAGAEPALDDLVAGAPHAAQQLVDPVPEPDVPSPVGCAVHERSAPPATPGAPDGESAGGVPAGGLGEALPWRPSERGPAAAHPGAPRTWVELLFLSFTTLTSTGLSDVIPVRPFARGVVMLEQLAGPAYVAMLVSRLVGMLNLRGNERP